MTSRVSTVSRAAPSSPPKASPSADLLSLERGEIDRATYLERCVEAAVRGLSRALSTQELELVREVLREQMATDPVILSTLERLTGRNDGSSE